MSDSDADVEAELVAQQMELDAQAARGGGRNNASSRLLNIQNLRASAPATRATRRPSSSTSHSQHGSTSFSAGGLMHSPRQQQHENAKEDSVHSKEGANNSPRFTPRGFLSRMSSKPRSNSKESSTFSNEGSVHSPRFYARSLLSRMSPKQRRNSKDKEGIPRSILSLMSSPKQSGHAKVDMNYSKQPSLRSLRHGSDRSLLSRHSQQDALQLKMLEASSSEEHNENNHIKLLPTNIPGIDAEGTAANPKPNSLLHRLPHVNGADVGILEREGEEEPEGRQYARAGRPFLMMRPAKAALLDFSNAMPENENSVQFIKQQHLHSSADDDGSSSSSESDDDSDDAAAVAPGMDPTVTQRVQKETNRVLSILRLKSKKKRKRRRGKDCCGALYRYRLHLVVIILSFSVAGGVHVWQGSEVEIAEDVPVSVLVALPGLLSVLYLICGLLEYIILGLAARMLMATPWNVRNIVKVLHFHFRIIAMFVIADVATNIWLHDYRNTDGALYLRGTFRSVYAVSICIVLKRIVIDASIHSLSRTHYARRVKHAIREEDYLDMVASTGCSLSVREKLKARRRLGNSWRSYGFTERSRRLTMQAMMLPYVRTQDDVSGEVAYYFSTDMVIEVNTVRGMRVLAYVLFDTLVKHVQYLQGLQLDVDCSDSESGSSGAAPDGYESIGGGYGSAGETIGGGGRGSGTIWGNNNGNVGGGNGNGNISGGNGTVGGSNGIVVGGSNGIVVGGIGHLGGGNGHIGGGIATIGGGRGNGTLGSGGIGPMGSVSGGGNGNFGGGNGNMGGLGDGGGNGFIGTIGGGGGGGIDGTGTGTVGGGVDDGGSAAVAVDSLTFAQWNSCFNDRAQAQRARKLIFTQRQLSAWRDNKSSRVIRRQDFVQACVALFIKRELLASQVTNFNKLSAVVSALVSRLLMVLLVFVLAACFEVDIRELLVSASAVLLSVSFALGSSISRGIESIIFVFGTYAYSIGDRVVIGPKDSAKAAYVQSVDLLTSTFCQTTGEVFVMSNADLARERIFNLRRSTNAVIVLSFVVSFNTTWSAIDELKTFIMHYLEKHISSWKPGADLYVNALKRTESMEIEFWIESVHSWQSAAIVYLAQTKLLRQIRLKMTVLGIKWEPTPQTLQVEMKQKENLQEESDSEEEVVASAMQRPVPGRRSSMAVRPNVY